MRPSSTVSAAVEEAEKGRLARAARAGDEDELAALDDQVHAAQDGRALPVRLEDVLEDEDRALRRLAREARVARAQERAKALRVLRPWHAFPGIREARRATTFRPTTAQDCAAKAQ